MSSTDAVAEQGCQSLLGHDSSIVQDILIHCFDIP